MVGFQLRIWKLQGLSMSGPLNMREVPILPCLKVARLTRSESPSPMLPRVLGPRVSAHHPRKIGPKHLKHLNPLSHPLLYQIRIRKLRVNLNLSKVPPLLMMLRRSQKPLQPNSCIRNLSHSSILPTELWMNLDYKSPCNGERNLSRNTCQRSQSHLPRGK
jgi:hypothetical protein